jgi:hypothetical protein
VYPQDPRYSTPYAGPPQAPYPYGSAAAPPPSSGAPRTLGILSIVFAGLLIASSLWSFVSAISTAAMGPVLASFFPTAGMPPDVLLRWAICTAATAGLMLFMSSALLATGIGLVKRRGWAYLWTNVWAWVSFPVLVVRLLVWHLGVEPATATAVAAIVPAGAALHGRHFLGFEDAWCMLLAVYPILLLAMVPRRGP